MASALGRVVALARRAILAPALCSFVRAASSAKMVTLTINDRPVSVPEGKTVLEACREADVYVPTLCHHPVLRGSGGTCRICLVEVQGSGKLLPSCVTKAEDGMVINTENDEILKSIRSNLSLLRSRHPNDCMTCEANGHCQFQDLLYRYQIEGTYPKLWRTTDLDVSSASLVRDMDKCVMCGRCVQVCDGLNILGIVDKGNQGIPTTVFDLPLNSTDCINCGQCSLVCPVGAIIEKPHLHTVLSKLHKKEGKIHVVQTAPAVRVALGEEFNMRPGSISTGRMVAALRRLGFDYVFDTNFAADLTTVEEATEFAHRLQKGGPFPMFTSCCPAWINLVEKLYPQFIPNVSSCTSPQQMNGSMIKTFFARKIGVSPEEIVVTSVMPCTAKKDEASRKQLEVTGPGVPAVDHVLTTRELARMIDMKKIPFATLPEEDFDAPLGLSTGSAAIFGATGGVMESALRTAYETVTGERLPDVRFEAVRGFDAVKEATVNVAGTDVHVAVVHGAINVRKLLEQIESGEKNYHFVEVMICPGGCIGGGGEPKEMHSWENLEERRKAIYEIDDTKEMRRSHENPALKELYDDFLGHPNSELAEYLLHTHYTDRSKIDLEALTAGKLRNRPVEKRTAPVGTTRRSQTRR